MKLTPHLPIKYGANNISGGEDNPPPVVPSDARGVGHFYKSFDSRLWMFYRHWEPANTIVATLMIVHGTVDHSGVYQELATVLNKHGVAVIAMDMRGWGLSDGESMYFNDIETFVEDVHTLYTRIHDTNPRYQTVKARFLLGKSLGGLVTAHAIQKYPTLWTGLLGLSGAYSLGPSMNVSPIKHAAIQLVAACCPKLPVKPLFDEHLIVSDEQALQQWRDDKLCCKDRLRIGYAVEILRAIQELPKHNMNMKISMLMMIGSEDRVVTRDGHQLMLDLNASSDKELKVYPEGRHNLLQEPSLKDSVTNDIVNWIIARADKT
jgi:acylglycerol lipase